MKVIIFVFGFFLSSMTIAQVDILSMSLNDPSLKVLYIGVENEVKIIGVKIDSSINLVSSKSTIHHFASKDRSEYVVKYKRVVIDTLRVYKGDEIIFEARFEIKAMPSPVVRMGKIKDNSATIEDIFNDPEINIVVDECLWKKKYTFKTFDLILIDNTGNIVNRYDDVPGNKLTKDQLKIIKNLKPGNTLIVKNIFAQLPGSEGRSMRPLSIAIK